MRDALNYAARYLPEGYIIEINVEQGAAWATLFNAEADEVAKGPTDCDSTWHELISSMVNEARDIECEELVDALEAEPAA